MCHRVSLQEGLASVAWSALCQPLQGSPCGAALPGVMFHPREPTPSDWWKPGYKGPAISPQCRTTPKGHLSSGAPSEVSKDNVTDSPTICIHVFLRNGCIAAESPLFKPGPRQPVKLTLPCFQVWPMGFDPKWWLQLLGLVLGGINVPSTLWPFFPFSVETETWYWASWATQMRALTDRWQSNKRKAAWNTVKPPHEPWATHTGWRHEN